MITVKAKLSLLTICIALPFGTLAQTGMTTEQRFELMEQRLQAAEQRANKAEAEIASLKKAQTQPSAVNTATAAPQQVASVADNKKPADLLFAPGTLCGWQTADARGQLYAGKAISQPVAGPSGRFEI